MPLPERYRFRWQKKSDKQKISNMEKIRDYTLVQEIAETAGSYKCFQKWGALNILKRLKDQYPSQLASMDKAPHDNDTSTKLNMNRMMT